MQSEPELSDDQLNRQDYVDSAIFALLSELAGQELPWDIALVGAVRDTISDEFEERGIMPAMDFYPWIEE